MAAISCETGIAPNDLLDTSPEMFNALVAYLQDRGEQAKKVQDKWR